jgi:glycosyltransferase involved in cell wall biosynthesis
MGKVSIIIPSRNEKYIDKTVDDLFAKASGEIEVIVVVDGVSQYPLPKERANLSFIHKALPEGLRPALKDASYKATGKYLMKVDAHTMISEGYDEVLKKDFEDNWVVVSRYYALDAENWTRITDHHGRDSHNDYFYLGCPWVNYRRFSFLDVPWKSRDMARANIIIDETMTMQASMWFMTLDHFHNTLGDLDVGRFGTWSAEQEEIVFKTWLSGGKMMVNKNVWNAHYQRKLGERDREFPDYSRNREASERKNLALYFLRKQWEGQIYTIDWLIDRFCRCQLH